MFRGFEPPFQDHQITLVRHQDSMHVVHGLNVHKPLKTTLDVLTSNKGSVRHRCFRPITQLSFDWSQSAIRSFAWLFLRVGPFSSDTDVKRHCPVTTVHGWHRVPPIMAGCSSRLVLCLPLRKYPFQSLIFLDFGLSSRSDCRQSRCTSTTCFFAPGAF